MDASGVQHVRSGGVVRRRDSWVQAKTTVVGDRDIGGNLVTCPGVGGEIGFLPFIDRPGEAGAVLQTAS